MAGTTAAERGDRERVPSGPPLLRRLRRLKARTMIILAVTVTLLGAGCVWLLYGSPWLRVDRVAVSGTRVLTPAEVRRAAAVPVGSPLLSVDTAAIGARLRRELPRIRTVEVFRSWPHGIGLKITERTPVLVLEKSGRFIEVDGQGVRFATVSRRPAAVPTLDLDLSSPGSAGASLRRFGQDRLVREAVAVAGRLPAAAARDTRVVKVRSYDDISLELTGGRTVAWGSAGNGPAKARTLTALMKASPGSRHFDVSVPTAPASARS
ncbi:FtsQ-type POTRA domain-containing protein [Streptomyces sp. NPDC047000]|uniref:cell division protein FtsQ/DivIB n=1 Tax=Streptomyces sp. NPDC047000 TaxID=3155474 RepID=UPI0034111B67